MESSFAALAGMGLLAILVMVVVGVAIAAGVLALSYRIVVGAMPSYLRALGAVVVTAIASGIVAAILRAITGGGAFVVLVAQFLIGAAVINYLLPRAGQPIGYGKACLVQLVYLVGEVVLAILIGIVMAVFFGGMLAGMHGG